MFIQSLLAAVEAFSIDQIENVIHLDWLGNLIKSLIEGCGSIGLGIIVFTVILKLITLPFDIFSRVSTKKNSVKMEKLRPELEKLQKQYSNNKEIYQQKMQDLYKKNGYSPFAACLPTVLNLVVFIIVIGQFSTYSNYANFGVFCRMSEAYIQAIDEYNENSGTEYIIKITQAPEEEVEGAVAVEKDYIDLVYFYENDENLQKFGFDIDEKEKYNAEFTYLNITSDKIKLLAEEIEKGENGALKTYTVGEGGHILYNSDTDTYSFNEARFDASLNDEDKDISNGKKAKVLCTEIVSFYAATFSENIKEVGRAAAAELFRNEELSFLWVKNIWSQDLPWQHPVKKAFSEYGFVKSGGCIAACKASCGGESNSITSVTNNQYDELTAHLQAEKETPNGYLILVILSIGTMLLSQIVMQKANKAQTELSSVDGENGTAAQSQKMMTWMMPIMFGVFSFMYTASFSIYIIINSLFGLISTIIINFIVDAKFAKLAKKEAEELELKRTGKITQINKDNDKNKKK